MIELSPETTKNIRCAADIIRQSKEAIVLTGAGISTPSGIPDFRSTDSGLWEQYDPFEVASLSAFRYQPERFFKWMRPLAINMFDAIPNDAHIGLAKLEQSGYLKTIITQNIDSLHQRAGSMNVIEIHGSLKTLTCVSCFDQYNSDDFIDTYLNDGTIPHCPACNNVLKPDVVLMGEQLPITAWQKAQDASKKCDLMIVAGSSLEVIPVATLPMRVVDNGAHLIIINRSETYINVRADVVFLEDVAEIIPLIANEVLGE
ncbi:MAG: NAD-dependent deacylase [Anaerolineales bacterium]|nr:NAD-dependent deacylase [Anaerolineales bacterium]